MVIDHRVIVRARLTCLFVATDAGLEVPLPFNCRASKQRTAMLHALSEQIAGLVGAPGALESFRPPCPC